jgi:hypothetical protein
MGGKQTLARLGTGKRPRHKAQLSKARTGAEPNSQATAEGQSADCTSGPYYR